MSKAALTCECDHPGCYSEPVYHRCAAHFDGEEAKSRRKADRARILKEVGMTRAEFARRLVEATREEARLCGSEERFAAAEEIVARDLDHAIDQIPYVRHRYAMKAKS